MKKEKRWKRDEPQTHKKERYYNLKELASISQPAQPIYESIKRLNVDFRQRAETFEKVYARVIEFG